LSILMNLSLDRVLRFVAVAEQLSFTRAAALLGIDQPWLSKQVMQLEDQFGFMLFDRSGSRITLTPEGAEFLRTATQLAEASDRVRRKAEEMSRRAKSGLRIGMSYATYPLKAREKLLETYKLIRPNVSLELSADELSDEVLLKVRAGEVDFGILLGPQTDPDLDVCVLDVLEPELAMPEEDPLSGFPSVSLADLAGRRIAVGLKDKTTDLYKNAYSWIDEVGAIAVHALEGRRFIFERAQKHRLFVLCYAPDEKVPENFVRRRIRNCPFRIELCLTHARRTLSPAGERLWRLAQEQADERRNTVS
jgi:DNA-binding transcriptional LysR family regulator